MRKGERKRRKGKGCVFEGGVGRGMELGYGGMESGYGGEGRVGGRGRVNKIWVCDKKDEAYVDDINTLLGDPQDMIKVDEIFSKFEKFYRLVLVRMLVKSLVQMWALPGYPTIDLTLDLS